MQLEFDGLAITVTWKAVKNINMRIMPPDGKISISAPHGLSQEVLLEFLDSRRAWLHEKVASFSGAPDDDRLEHWGRRLPLEIVKKPGPVLIEQKAQKIVLSAPKALSRAAVTRVIDNWRKTQVLARAVPLLELWRGRLNLAQIRVVCKTMKSRWGSCAWYKNMITLNSLLATKPELCLELVLVHELTHFFEHGHGPGFYKRLAAALPDWQKRARMLKSDAPAD